MDKPKSKMAALRVIWPAIVDALEGGHTLKSVCARLNEDGVLVEYPMLRAYMTVLRREQAHRSAALQESKLRLLAAREPVHVPPRSETTICQSNPVATAMEYLGKVRGFQNFTGAPPDPDKIF